jgi:phage pi2 protein 07
MFTKQLNAYGEGRDMVDSDVEYVSRNEYQELKARIHDRLIDMMDLSRLDSVDYTEPGS